jgi:hypothetical protein
MAPEHKTMATLLVSDTASQRGDTMLETPPRKNRDQRQVGKVEREKFGAATCKICQDTIEDLHHFAVGCLDKWKVWHHAMIQYDTSFATYTPQIPLAAVPIKAGNNLHTYYHAILQACKSTQLSHAHKSQLLNFVQAMNLTPISLTNDNNGERNALIHENLVMEMCSTLYNIVTPVTRKRMKLDLPSQLKDSDLTTILSTSPYSRNVLIIPMLKLIVR